MDRIKEVAMALFENLYNLLNTYSQEQSEVLTIDQVVTLKAQFDMLINQLSHNQDLY